MNILSAIGYNTQSNLKTAAGCGTEREQRHSTGGILKWQKIMSLKTRTAKIQQTDLMKMRSILRIARILTQKTAAKTRVVILTSLGKILLPDIKIF